MRTPLIEFHNVEKSFGTNHVLRGTSLQLYQGEVSAIIGKSGCGKSVLLKHIIGLLEQDSGTIAFEGKDIKTMTRKEKRAFRRRFSYMFQDNALFDSLSIMENIALPLREKAELKKREIDQKVLEMLEKLELSHTTHLFPAELSGGMRKRVALARALITAPEIILFDEPTTGLDPIRKFKVHEMIENYRKMFHFTGIIVSHEIPEVFDICQRVVMLDRGKVAFQGSVDDIMTSQDETIRSFIHKG